jgi:hypothetical protein
LRKVCRAGARIERKSFAWSAFAGESRGRVDEQREERDERGERDLGPDAETEPRHQDRRERDLRGGVDRHEERHDDQPAERGLGHEDAEQDPGDGREQEADQDLLG